ncbi:uncharacterized protein AMSG_02044 [Thecamonas trahens ATCC 50062]|uniref:Ras-GAP domain-containing protein n=1 Tax=Thecamonas trahens ATCC 50062 TaxID=461836 RepID=A0A0L0DV11_THETB|nr:hypothetical protein AMSG_02044 [Thecamonas trahens ATCC 50062]KNC56032.1 hypothetical protein AMSG_02044 [Thecamonas trahens ATCC 50062]|eukprot:XP_013761076.1 hypothetical protein AMSG_02044 [Thecamonas trahens ATCC 50062]
MTEATSTGPQRYVGFAPVGKCDGLGSGFNLLSTTTALLTGSQPYTFAPKAEDCSASGVVFEACLSNDHTISASPIYVGQTGARVTVACPLVNAITELQPSTFLNSTQPTLKLVGAVPSPETFVALSLDRDCSSVFGKTNVISTTTVAINVVIARLQPHYICYSTSGISGTFVPQTLVELKVTSDPVESSLVSISPRIIGAGTQPSLEVTGDISSTSQLGFDISPDCAAPVAVTAITTAPTTTTPLGAPILSPGKYFACFRNDTGDLWTKQIASEARLEVVAAQPASIATVSPSAFGASTTPELQISGLVATPDTYFALTTSTCDAAVALTEVSAATPSPVMLASGVGVGMYSICYSTNYTTLADMILQSSPGATVKVVEATTTSITAVSHPSLPFGSEATLTFSGGADLVPTPLGAVRLVVGACSGTEVVTFSLSSSLSVDLGAIPEILENTYTVCYSVDGVSSLAQVGQTVSFYKATFLSATDFVPSNIGASTSPRLQTTAAFNLPTASLALVPYNGDCTSASQRVATVVVGASPGAVTFPPITPAQTAAYDVCANEDPSVSRSPWMKQSGATIVVHTAATGSITSISPTVAAKGQIKQFSFVPATPVISIVPTPFAYIAFSAQQIDCTQRVGAINVSESFTSVFMDDVISTTGTYQVCFSVDNQVTWTQQSGVSLDIIEATQASVASLTPTVVGFGTTPRFSGLDQLRVTSDSFVFLSTASDCSTTAETIPVVVPDGNNTMPASAPLSNAGEFFVCYTVDNFQTRVLQTSATKINIIQAQATSITSVTPVIGANHASVQVAFAGVADFLPSDDSRVAFVLSGASCSSPAARRGETLYSPSNVVGGKVALATAMTVPGLYEVCYTVDDGASWVQQTTTGVVMRVIAPTSEDVLSIAPGTVSVGVPITFDIGLNATSVSAVPSPSSYIAIGDTSGNCSTVLAPAALTALPAKYSVASGFTDPGMYPVCWSTDGGSTYEVQGDVELEVVLTSNTTVTALSVSRIGEGEATPIELVGAVSTPKTLAAFIPMGQSCKPSPPSSVALTSSTIIPSLSLGLTPGVYKLCYSTDASVWTEQILVQLEVVSCLPATTCSGCHARESGKCTWCQGDSTCRAINTAPVCTQQVLNATVGCPTLEPSTDLAGSLAGRTPIPMVSQFDFPTPIEAYTCEFTLTDSSSVFVTNASSTADPKVINCISGSVSEAGRASVVLKFLGQPYTDGSVVLFRYYDCAASSCDACFSSSKPECGYCFGDAFCGTQFECTEGATTVSPLWSQDACSEISNINPVSGSPDGGDLITVTGTNFAEGVNYGCVFSTTQYNESTWNSQTEVVCTSPPADVGSVFQFSLSYRDTGLPYTTGSAVYTVVGADAAPSPSPSFVTSPLAIGGGVLILCILAIVIAVVILLVTRRGNDGVEVPKLTPALLRETIFGKGLSNPQDARTFLAHIGPFMDILKEENRQAIFAVCDVTQATEADDISKAMIYVFERDNHTVAVLSAFVRKEIKAAISQSTMFRTNSFATKMFKAYSKMVGLPYLHATLAVLINRIMVQEGENIGSFRSAAGATDANRSKFTLLTSCQKIFNAIVRSEKNIPVQFRQIFAVVRECIREEFPIKMENLAAVVSSQMLNGLHSTREAYEEGVDSFQNLEFMDEHVTDDLEQLKHVIAPVQSLVQTFASTVQTLSVQLKKMMTACESLEGALDPTSPAARRLLEEHTNSQNSIAVGGFFFLRFLVPAITAPESYVLVSEAPLPDERRALIMVGKVLQNLSNNKEFGGKEQHMQQLNDFIFSNKNEVNALFERLCKMDVFVAPPPVEIPKKHFEAAQLKLFLHTKRNLLKVVNDLLESKEGTPADIVSLRQQTAGNLVATIESIVSRCSPGGSLSPEDASLFDQARTRVISAMSGARSVVQGAAASSSSSSSSDDNGPPGTPETLVNPSPLSQAAHGTDADGGIELTAL